LLLVCHVWFSIIGFSTVFTYQHHVVDALGGFVLAAFCYYLLREQASQAIPAANRSVGLLYALGAALLLGLAIWARSWAWLLLWPALAMATAATAYMGVGAAIYRKENGRLPLSAKLILLPVLLGHWLSFLHYRRQCNAWDEAAPNVLIGRLLSAKEAAEAVKCGVSAVLDLTAESSENKVFKSLHYLNIPILDLTAPSLNQLKAGVDFINAHRGQGKVYIHCKVGYSRSVAMVAAWMMRQSLACSAKEAIARLRQVRPSLVSRDEIQKALQSFENCKASLSNQELMQ
jgi:protein-tyrosine phosphatase